MQLLSIQGIDLGRNEYVSGFEIDTYGIRVLAVCRIPRGWSISAGGDATPVGMLAGNAGQGVAFLDAASLAQLQQLFLIDDPGEIADAPRGARPQTFNGRIHVGVYGSEKDAVRRRLKPANYVLTPAPRCPDPV